MRIGSRLKSRKRWVVIALLILILVVTVIFALFDKFHNQTNGNGVVDQLKDPKYIAGREEHIGVLINSEKDLKTPEAKVANYRDLTVEYNNLKQYDKSISVLQKAIELTPNDYSLHAYLAQIYAMNKEKDKALKEFDEAADLAKKYGGSAIKLDKYLEFINREKAAL